MAEHWHCADCLAELDRWALDGVHLSCRACEARAAVQRPDLRARFYSELARRARGQRGEGSEKVAAHARRPASRLATGAPA